MLKQDLLIVALSDTHGLHASMKHDVPDGDVLIHAGDFGGRGLMTEIHDFAEWMGSLPHPLKLVTPGNHDRPVEENAGCFELFDRLRTVRPKVHVFGHIHEGYGVTVSDEVHETTFLNASICTEAYRPENAPHQFRLNL